MSINLIGEWPVALAKAATAVDKAIRKSTDLKLPSGEINVKLVDAAESQELNKRYSGNAYATDVLTFNYYQDEPAASTAADIVICQSLAVRQAQEAGNSLADEIALLAAHALLHVAGHDHADAAERTAMDSLQQQLLKQAGYDSRNYKWED